MTIALHPLTVSASIAALSISGVTIKDVDEIPDSAAMLCPLIVPRPNDFITNIQAVRQSFGGGGTARIDFTYTLNYAFLFCEAGSGQGAFAPYDGLLEKLVTILETMLTNDDISGAVDMQVDNIGEIGVISDPSNKNFWGVHFSLRCLEHAQ